MSDHDDGISIPPKPVRTGAPCGAGGISLTSVVAISGIGGGGTLTPSGQCCNPQAADDQPAPRCQVDGGAAVTQSCGNCHWWGGLEHTDDEGVWRECSAPIPDSVVEVLPRDLVLGSSGTECPSWRSRSSTG